MTAGIEAAREEILPWLDILEAHLAASDHVAGEAFGNVGLIGTTYQNAYRQSLRGHLVSDNSVICLAQFVNCMH